MRTTDVVKMTGGAMVVYTVMAACGSSGGGHFADALDGGADAHHLDALVDSIVNPVGDAKADVNTSGSRLKARYYAGDDGSKQYAGWRDTQRNEDCGFAVASDGLLHCMPSGAYVNGLFVDAGCSQALASAPKGCAAPAYSIAYDGSTACASGRQRVYLGGAKFTAATVYAMSGGTCTGSSSAPFGASIDLYFVGAEVPPSNFVSAVVQVEQ